VVGLGCTCSITLATYFSLRSIRDNLRVSPTGIDSDFGKHDRWRSGLVTVMDVNVAELFAKLDYIKSTIAEEHQTDAPQL
jgi:hypothetical protein